jgi:leader peptidase (prepilin peptidase)/N-methyltransferase
MTFVDALTGLPWLLQLTVALIGAIVGSFLNVVAFRVPKMMEAEWRHEAHAILELDAPAERPRLSLVHPPSTCPHCGAPIKPWHNLPILGWLWLRGRAACCGGSISMQYPLVESLSLLLSLLCAVHYGPTPALAASLVFTWFLIALAVIDFNTHYLPDLLTFPLLWLGLLLSLTGLFTHPAASILGAASGYLSLWSVHHLFRLLTGREGMGYGDFKLLAALGAWMGWQALPMIILLSSLVGSVVGISLILLRRLGRDQPIGFGPYLAGAGFLALLYGHALQQAYLHSSGIG